MHAQVGGRVRRGRPPRQRQVLRLRLLGPLVPAPVGGGRGWRARRVRLAAGARAPVQRRRLSPPEARAAAARERRVALVDQRVGFQLIRVRKTRRAARAGVRPLAGVHAQVAPEVGDLHKVAWAVRAAVRLLPCVQAEMRLEVVVPGETFVALAALERFLSGVGALVVLEDVFVAEGAGADFAGEEFVAGRVGGAGRGAGGGRRGRRGVIELGRAAALARALELGWRQQRRGRRGRPRGQQRARVQLGRQPRHQRGGARRQQTLCQHRQ